MEDYYKKNYFNNKYCGIGISREYEEGFKSGYAAAGRSEELFDLSGYNNGYMTGYHKGIQSKGIDSDIKEILSELEDGMLGNIYFSQGEYLNNQECYDDGYKDGYAKACKTIKSNINSSLAKKIKKQEYYDLVVSSFNRCIIEINNGSLTLEPEVLSERFIYLFSFYYSLSKYLLEEKFTLKDIDISEEEIETK